MVSVAKSTTKRPLISLDRWKVSFLVASVVWACRRLIVKSFLPSSIELLFSADFVQAHRNISLILPTFVPSHELLEVIISEHQMRFKFKGGRYIVIWEVERTIDVAVRPNSSLTSSKVSSHSTLHFGGLLLSRAGSNPWISEQVRSK